MSRLEPVLPRHDEDHGIQLTWKDVVKKLQKKAGKFCIILTIALVAIAYRLAPMAEMTINLSNTEKKMQAAQECENMQSLWFTLHKLM